VEEAMPGPLDFLTPVNTAVSIVKSLLDEWRKVQDRQDSANKAIAADLMGLLEELRKTNSTIVKLVSPVRRIKDDPQTFAGEWQNVYADFRDAVDAYDFIEERMHCHKIEQIRTRMSKRKPRFGNAAQWQQFDQILIALGSADFGIIDLHYKPFVANLDAAMRQIDGWVQANDPAQAIAAKQTLLADLAPGYDQTKALLTEMSDAIAQLTNEL
jgi:hypothetical protein